MFPKNIIILHFFLINYLFSWCDPQVVLLEGWMLGFKPLPNNVVKEVDPQVSHLISFFNCRCLHSILFCWWAQLHFILFSSFFWSELHFIFYETFQLEVVNKNLEAYYDAWDKFIQSWVVIKIKDPSCVFQWRLQVCYNTNMLIVQKNI